MMKVSIKIVVLFSVLAFPACTPLGSIYIRNQEASVKSVRLVLSDDWKPDSLKFKVGQAQKLGYNSHKNFESSLTPKLIDSKTIELELLPNSTLFLGPRPGLESVFKRLLIYERDTLYTISIDSLLEFKHFEVFRRLPNKYIGIYTFN